MEKIYIYDSWNMNIVKCVCCIGFIGLASELFLVALSGKGDVRSSALLLLRVVTNLK